MTKHIKDKSVYSRKCSEEAKRRMSECRIGKHYSPRTEFKKGCAPLNKGKKWITNGVINKYINESDFNYWASQGWRFGCIQKRK